MAGLLTDPVAAELRRWAAEPFDLGAANCGLSVLDYAERVSGRTVTRGRGITGRRAAVRLMRRPEAFLSVCAGLMRALGCTPVAEPVRGDIGLADLAGGMTAAICLAGAGAGLFMWGARGDRAVILDAAEPIVAWRLPCPRR